MMTVLFWLQRKRRRGGEICTPENRPGFRSNLGHPLLSKEWAILKTLFFDVFFSDGSFRKASSAGSSILSIYLSILFRFGLSLFTLFVYRLSPASALAQALIDKNHPVCGLHQRSPGTA